MSFDEIFDLTAGVYFNFYNMRDESEGTYVHTCTGGRKREVDAPTCDHGLLVQKKVAVRG